MISQHIDYKAIFQNTATIAVVGLSPKNERPSNMVARYLLERGYTVIPVNPGHDQILGQRCRKSLADIEEQVDIVDIFRKSAELMPIVEAAVAIGAKVIWMQLGLVHEEAAAYARAHGLTVIMDRCLKVDHQAIMER
ncbi:MAG: CoA-binding protein [Desulfobulbaceae bacterium]|jgi:predicted CoA-binding protein|nr:CoA-binding protein [Desulfobulbaceae bacterium]